MNNPMDISRLYGLNNTDKANNNHKKYMPDKSTSTSVDKSKINNNNNTENLNQNKNDPNASAAIKILSNNKAMPDSKNSDMKVTIPKSCCSKRPPEAVPYPLRNQTDSVMYHDPNSPYPTPTTNTEKFIQTNAVDIKSEYSDTNTSSMTGTMSGNDIQATVPWKNNNVMNHMTSTTVLSDMSHMNNADNMMNTSDINMPYSETTFPQQYRVTPQSMQCMNGFLRSQTGKIAEVEFIVDGITRIKQGYLTAIGDNYLLITEIDTGKLIVCDHSTLKFVTLYN